MRPVFELEADDVLTMPDEVAHRAASDKPMRKTRRLSDKVLVAFHHACDTSDLEIAGRLLNLIEFMLTRNPIDASRNSRHNIEGLVAAHERLWYLRHQTADQSQ